MGLQATLVLYAVIGAGVAGAMFIRSDARHAGRWFEVLSAAMFWPLYVPLLLNESSERPATEPPELLRSAIETEPDELVAAIVQAEAELDAAVASLDGWAEQTLACESGRLAELKQAWWVQASRIRELTQLLERSANDCVVPSDEGPIEFDGNDRRSESEAARRANLRRLRDLREKMRADLLETLAWVRELVTMIHLARYTGAPASQAADLVAQIAAAVEGLSEISELQAEEPVVVGA